MMASKILYAWLDSAKLDIRRRSSSLSCFHQKRRDFNLRQSHPMEPILAQRDRWRHRRRLHYRFEEIRYNHFANGERQRQGKEAGNDGLAGRKALCVWIVLDANDSQISPAQRLILSQALQQAIAILKAINKAVEADLDGIFDHLTLCEIQWPFLLVHSFTQKDASLFRLTPLDYVTLLLHRSHCTHYQHGRTKTATQNWDRKPLPKSANASQHKRFVTPGSYRSHRQEGYR